MKILTTSTLIGVLISAPFFATANTAEDKINRAQTKAENKISRAQDKTERVISDAMITAKVKELYLEDENISSFKIHVETKDQVVFLTGKVNTDYEKNIAKDLAKNVKGVKNVKCKLKVTADPE